MDQNTFMSMVLGYTPEGSKMVYNQDGTISTELTATEQHPQLNNGRWTNIPTLVNGRQLDPETAIVRAIMSPKQYPSFDSLPEAESYAHERTGFLGKLLGEYEQQRTMPRPHESILNALMKR